MKEINNTGAAAIPDPLPTSDEIAARLDPYIEAHAKKVRNAENTYKAKQAAAAEAAQQAKDKMLKAIDAGDLEAADKYSKQATDAMREIERLEVLLTQIEASATFPPGSVMHEWETVCSEYENAYMAALASAKEAAMQYETAVALFMEMHSTLLSARAKMQETARMHGSNENIISRVITAGMKGENFYWIKKQDAICIPNAVDPAFSKGL